MLVLTDDNFEKEINKENQKPILVDFWAEWCFPCSALGPILERVEKKFKEEIIFYKINVDSAPQTSQKFQIDRIPQVILFENGKIFDSFVGARLEEEIEKWLKNNLKKMKEKK